MNRLIPILFAGAAALGGCASRASMDARYDASLQRWQGATRAELESAWGKPSLQAAVDGREILTYVVRVDIGDRATAGGPAAPSVVITRTPGGGVAASTISPSLPTAVALPITCTTQFTLKDGRVDAWKFEGLGCGAPR